MRKAHTGAAAGVDQSFAFAGERSRPDFWCLCTVHPNLVQLSCPDTSNSARAGLLGEIAPLFHRVEKPSFASETTVFRDARHGRKRYSK